MHLASQTSCERGVFPAKTTWRGWAEGAGARDPGTEALSGISPQSDGHLGSESSRGSIPTVLPERLASPSVTLEPSALLIAGGRLHIKSL